MRTLIAPTAFMLGLLGAGFAQAAAPAQAAQATQPVEQIAARCTACHGADGNAMVPMFPSLAGQWEDYLLHSMREYQSGARTNALMGMQLNGLTDADLKNLAAFYAAKPSKLSHTPLSK